MSVPTVGLVGSFLPVKLSVMMCGQPCGAELLVNCDADSDTITKLAYHDGGARHVAAGVGATAADGGLSKQCFLAKVHRESAMVALLAEFTDSAVRTSIAEPRLSAVNRTL